jgi:hypothetical protein
LTLCNNFSYDQPTDLHPYLTLHFKTYQSTHNLQPANSHKYTQLTPKTASVVPPEDGRLTPETCRGVRHNQVIVKVKVYSVGYVIVMHNLLFEMPKLQRHTMLYSKHFTSFVLKFKSNLLVKKLFLLNTALAMTTLNLISRTNLAPWYVRNADLHRDLRIEMLTAEVRRFARKHEERLLHHDNVEAIQLLDNSKLIRRLRRTKLFINRYYYRLISLLRQFLPIPNRNNKLMNLLFL